MDLKDIKEILELVDEKAITEFELEEGGMRLRIRKDAASANYLPAAAPPASMPPVGVVAAALAPATPASTPATAPARTTDDAAGLVQVTSPIVGTFYRAADPNSPPFVNVGDRVKLGQVLCIVEAMKLMNEIEAETAGEIVKIHPENGQPVQYGDPLFTLRPDR